MLLPTKCSEILLSYCLCPPQSTNINRLNWIPHSGSERVFPGSGIWPKYIVDSGKRSRSTPAWLLPGKPDSPKFWARMRIKKENDIRDSDKISSGCGILVKKGAGMRHQWGSLVSKPYSVYRFGCFTSRLDTPFRVHYKFTWHARQQIWSIAWAWSWIVHNLWLITLIWVANKDPND